MTPAGHRLSTKESTTTLSTNWTNRAGFAVLNKVDSPGENTSNAVDPAPILKDFPSMGEATEPALRNWLDSEANLFVLCEKDHRGGQHGVHMITMPAWIAQRYKKNHDITTTGEQ